MNLSATQFEQILSNVPNTALIMFGEDLRILRIMDRDHLLNEIYPDISSIGYLTEIDDSRWSSSIEEICRNTLQGTELASSAELMPVQQQFMGTSGQVIAHTISLPVKKGEHFGILILQGNRGLMNESRDELEREKEEAEATSESKSRFMARLSHEIRTPLNAIIGFIEQLHKTSLNETQENYLKIIDQSSIYLLDLVNEILTFSKIESGEQKLDMVDFNIETLFNEIYNTLKIRAREKNINFRYSFDKKLKLILRGDTFRLKQIVNNLISNAIKFTEYGYVELKVMHLKEEDNRVWIRFTVSDTGIGISRDKIKDVFKEYKQASAGIARKHGGTGLGLTISKRLTELMNGRISVKSTEGKGSRFIVEIPMEKSERSFLTKDTLKINHEVLSGKSALIVDDDAMNRMLGEIILEGFNMEVSLASDGNEAIHILGSEEFDIILLDIHMPIISGVDVAHHVRQVLKNKQVKILAVTADMIRDEWDYYLEQGIDDYIIKPYREINIFNKLGQVLDVDSDLIQHETIKIVLKEDEITSLYDLYELRSVTRDNPTLFNEMIQTFIDNAITGIKQIKYAYEKRENHEIRETAHRLIPSFKHLAIKSVVSDLIELKNISNENPEMDRLSLLITKIDKETTKVLGELKNELGQSR
ncbi:MAG: ATP-binding protein [Bacteroidota bacterium]|nr:ATP-binding protein [Bacteroidota bacterium]